MFKFSMAILQFWVQYYTKIRKLELHLKRNFFTRSKLNHTSLLVLGLLTAFEPVTSVTISPHHFPGLASIWSVLSCQCNWVYARTWYPMFMSLIYNFGKGILIIFVNQTHKHRIDITTPSKMNTPSFHLCKCVQIDNLNTLKSFVKLSSCWSSITLLVISRNDNKPHAKRTVACYPSMLNERAPFLWQTTSPACDAKHVLIATHYGDQ